MPKVPTIDAPTVDARPLPSPALHSVASPEVLGDAVRQQAELARGEGAARAIPYLPRGTAGLHRRH
jgi:hypothetical protein